MAHLSRPTWPTARIGFRDVITDGTSNTIAAASERVKGIGDGRLRGLQEAATEQIDPLSPDSDVLNLAATTDSNAGLSLALLRGLQGSAYDHRGRQHGDLRWSLAHRTLLAAMLNAIYACTPELQYQLRLREHQHTPASTATTPKGL